MITVHFLLDGYNLAGFIDDTSSPPSATITTTEVSTPNPKFEFWKRQDKLVYSALLGAITVAIQPILATTTTPAEIWKKLSDTYAMPSRGHVQQLKHAVKNWTKGDKSIDIYFQDFTTKFDELALLGKLYDHEDKLEFILNGLPEEYRSIKDQLEGRDVTPSLTEVHEKLLNKKAALLAATFSQLALPITGNAATIRQTNHYRGESRHNNRGHYQGNRGYQGSQPTRSNNHATRGYQGKYQISGIFGHSACTCSQLRQNGQNPSPHSTPWQTQAHVATAQSAYSPTWIMDSGATDHLTTDLHNLALHQPYHGGEKVIIANGSAIPISHTGSGSLSTLSKPLHLPNVLCVPTLHKNLLSVYHLYNNNNVTVQFYPTYFQMMDLRTGVLLRRGNTRNELYE